LKVRDVVSADSRRRLGSGSTARLASGETRADVEREIADAIAFHLDGLNAEGLEVPMPHSSTTYVDVPA
jgi:hypothetical protein